MKQIELDYNTFAPMLIYAETLHIDSDGNKWENFPLYYKVREAVYNECETIQLTQGEFLDFVLWAHCFKSNGDKEHFYFDKLKLIMYLHCYGIVKDFEREILAEARYVTSKRKT